MNTFNIISLKRDSITEPKAIIYLSKLMIENLICCI